MSRARSQVQDESSRPDWLTVARACRGEGGAFELLATGQRARLLRVALNILHDPQLAEDALQQALLDMWRGMGGLRDPQRFEAWSTRILVRECHRAARRQPRWLPDSRLSPADTPVAADDFGVVTDRALLEHGFRQISTDHRAVIVLHHLQDMTLMNVAHTLGIPVGTARSRYSRAMRALRAALASQADVTTAAGSDHSTTLRSCQASVSTSIRRSSPAPTVAHMAKASSVASAAPGSSRANPAGRPTSST